MRYVLISALFLLTFFSHPAHSREVVAGPGVFTAPVAKGENYFIYCLEATLQTDKLSVVQEIRRIGLTLLLVSPRTGEMHVLASTGLWAVNTRRLSFAERRMVGLLVSGDHAYLAFWHARSFDGPPLPLLDKPKEAAEHALRWQYELEVYDLASGAFLGGAVLNAGDGPRANIPQTPPEETATGGVLRRTEGKVEFFGASFAVEDGKVKGADAPRTTQPAPPETSSVPEKTPQTQ